MEVCNDTTVTIILDRHEASLLAKLLWIAHKSSMTSEIQGFAKNLLADLISKGVTWPDK